MSKALYIFPSSSRFPEMSICLGQRLVRYGIRMPLALGNDANFKVYLHQLPQLTTIAARQSEYIPLLRAIRFVVHEPVKPPPQPSTYLFDHCDTSGLVQIIQSHYRCSGSNRRQQPNDGVSSGLAKPGLAGVQPMAAPSCPITLETSMPPTLQLPGSRYRNVTSLSFRLLPKILACPIKSTMIPQ